MIPFGRTSVDQQAEITPRASNRRIADSFPPLHG